jgi:hypothetical protein
MSTGGNMLDPLIDRAWMWTAPYGTSARMLMGFYMMAQGTARVLFGSSLVGGVAFFPARVYGVLMLLGGLALLLTVRARWRYSWPGRTAAVVCAAIWLLIIAQAWGSWISIAGAFIFVLALVNEVRANA